MDCKALGSVEFAQDDRPLPTGAELEKALSVREYAGPLICVDCKWEYIGLKEYSGPLLCVDHRTLGSIESV